MGDNTGPASGITMANQVPTRRHRANRWLVPLLTGWSVIMLVVAVIAVVVRHNHDQQAGFGQMRASGIPSAVSTPLANLMSLSPVPHKPAPGFVLSDQTGRTLSFGSLRGKVVVLEFMDPHCVDICPLVSEEFVDAHRDLGRLANKVVFAAVNVNPFFKSPAAVLAFSQQHGLESIPSWHFFTGSTSALRAVWRAYGVQVAWPHPNGDIIHTSLVYFIDPHGIERYLASPMVDHRSSGAAYLPGGDIASWGRGIALVAKSLAS